LESELLSFPAAMHDDQVDALTQALRKLSKRKGNYNYMAHPRTMDKNWDMTW
jgi:phage terminase large subunit-like protein